jgi:murein DD-endopeptidase MepM/ murein hydrolase activator NlpD
MKVNSNTKVEARSSSSRGQAIPTKISIFYKSYITKAFSAIVLVLAILITPMQAHAGLFSFIGDLFGSKTFAAEDTVDEVVHNSQNVPLMEPNLTPEMKPGSNDIDVTIVGDQALESKTGPMGTEADFNNFFPATSKINVYTVKAGDTIDSIARANKVSKYAIIYANNDIKRSDLTKVGQVLVISPLRGAIYTVKKGETAESIAKKYGTSVSSIVEYNVLSKASDIKAGDTIILVGVTDAEIAKANKAEKEKNISKPAPKVVAPAPVQEEDNTPEPTPTPAPQVETGPTGQPSGNISGGYIWPFPAGSGRVSQGLHADQAYDFAAPIGTPIYAIQSGTVLIAKPTGYNGGYGKYVVINFDDGAQAIFGHMSQVVAEAGAHVNKGDVIGYVGSTGKSTGPHVHIGFHGGKPNPYKGLKVNSTAMNHD